MPPGGLCTLARVKKRHASSPSGGGPQTLVGFPISALFIGDSHETTNPPHTHTAQNGNGDGWLFFPPGCSLAAVTVPAFFSLLLKVENEGIKLLPPSLFLSPPDGGGDGDGGDRDRSIGFPDLPPFFYFS